MVTFSFEISKIEIMLISIRFFCLFRYSYSFIIISHITLAHKIKPTLPSQIKHPLTSLYHTIRFPFPLPRAERAVRQPAPSADRSAAVARRLCGHPSAEPRRRLNSRTGAGHGRPGRWWWRRRRWRRRLLGRHWLSGWHWLSGRHQHRVRFDAQHVAAFAFTHLGVQSAGQSAHQFAHAATLSVRRRRWPRRRCWRRRRWRRWRSTLWRCAQQSYDGLCWRCGRRRRQWLAGQLCGSAHKTGQPSVGGGSGCCRGRHPSLVGRIVAVVRLWNDAGQLDNVGKSE